MDRWKNHVAVITGATSDISKVLIKDLIKADLRVIGIAHHIDPIEEIYPLIPSEYHTRLFLLKCDLSNEVEAKNCFEWIEKNIGGTDILINNADLSNPKFLNDTNANIIKNVFDINVMGIIYSTQEAFKSMKARKFSGHVVLINSTVDNGIPRTVGTVFNIYSPSKYAMTAIMEMYRQDFFGFDTKVKITCINPGATVTETMSESVKKTGRALITPQDICDGIMYALGTPPNVQVHLMEKYYIHWIITSPVEELQPQDLSQTTKANTPQCLPLEFYGLLAMAMLKHYTFL